MKKTSQPLWAQSLARKLAPLLRNGRVAPLKQPDVLRTGIRALARVPRLKLKGLPDQPFDSHLLAISPLYRKNREFYLEGGGEFRSTLVSSPRTLSSPILLEQMIEYSPIERELIWAATDPKQAKSPEHLLQVRTYAASLFHEQSHRILWRWLPRPPSDPAGLRRYMNFVESLVITLDMALGDELGPGLASIFYLSGVTYDPGTEIGKLGLSRRDYRNYLQAALHATYLNLELYDPKKIPHAIEALFQQLGDLATRAAYRSGNLDRGFVTRTNPVWQKQHRVVVARALSRLPGPPMELGKDPMDHRLQYLFGERWLDAFGL